MKKLWMTAVSSSLIFALNAAPVLASTEEGQAPNPVKDFAIIFAIALIAIAVGYAAFKSAGKKVKE